MSLEPQKVQTAIDYIRAAGFTYDDEMVTNFYVCLKTKPFIILAGMSGTGKTAIARLFARAVSARFSLVSVSSSWKTDADLLGRWDPEANSYVDTRFSKIIRAATAAYSQGRPDLFFVCLDEMNLARVEHYFAKFLSAMEGLEVQDRRIELDGSGEVLYWPPNLFFVGTVNMDETTYNFSDKVLDRANSIEFQVTLDDLFMDTVKHEPPPPETFSLQEFLTFRKTLHDPGIQEVARKWRGEIVAIWKMLEPYQMHFGFRIRDEMELYMLNAQGLLDEQVAFDLQVKQKILPKIQGSGESLKMLLIKLQDYFTEKRYRYSARKVEEMKRRLVLDDVTGYYPGMIVRRRAGE